MVHGTLFLPAIIYNTKEKHDGYWTLDQSNTANLTDHDTIQKKC